MWDSFSDGVQTNPCAYTQMEMPDGYIKMVFKMILQFFIPRELIQDPVFSSLTTPKISITLNGLFHM